jgi:hypothetical protein
MAVNANRSFAIITQLLAGLSSDANSVLNNLVAEQVYQKTGQSLFRREPSGYPALKVEDIRRHLTRLLVVVCS